MDLKSAKKAGDKSSKLSLIETPIEVTRYISHHGSNQWITTHGKAEWRVSDLQALVKECELVPFDIPLQFLNLHGERFICEDIYEFMQHMKQVNEADLNEPIILSHRGQILDGRHRICRAIMEGKTSIKAVKLEYDVRPTKLN